MANARAARIIALGLIAVAGGIGGYWLSRREAVPIVGIVAQLKRGNALPIFGVWHLASAWPADRAAAHSVMEVHELLANAFLVFAALHAAAALIHHYVFHDRTLARMLPGGG